MNLKRTPRKFLYSIIGIIIAFIMIFVVLNQYYINYLWFDEVGYTQVFFKGLVTKLQIGIPTFIILFIILYFYFYFLRKVTNKRLDIIESKKHSKWDNRITFIISIVLSGLITMITTNALWYKLLEYFNSTSFGIIDPVFNKDISFYIFTLPLLEQLNSVISSIFFIIVFSTFIYSAFIYLSKGNQQIKYSEDKVEDLRGFFKSFGRLASTQIGIFLGLFFLLLAFGYYIKTFTLLYSTNGIAFGASYTDLNITLWIYKISLFLCIALAIFSIISGIRKNLKALVVGPLLLIVISFLGGIISYGVENYIVTPNQYEKEEKYLIRNIEYTQNAYGLSNITEKEFPVSQNITLEDIKNNKLTIDNIPINDYRPTLDMYNSIQGIRRYYQFNDIDIDRYRVNGQYTQVFLSAREMNNNKLEENAKTWINQHLKYTHGFGIAVSPINKVNEVGQPDLLVKDIPPQTEVHDISISEPRIYFGETTNTYAITNCKTMEFDYPEGSDNKENFYEGTAGIPMTPFNKIAFAINEGNMKFFLSSELSSESKILINRNIIERVNKIAPFLSYDKDPYLVIADGKLYWMIDAFTSSNRYPYSQPYNAENSFNYIRNSIKVVIDAYNGDVNFYQVDENDPIATVYGNIYPELIKPIDEMPGEIKDHIRYSQTMFDIQSDIYTTYHMSNPKVFYNREDQWEIATQMYSAGKEVEEVESSYIIMKLPERKEEFILMIPYTPRQKDNMVAWMAGLSDGDDYGKLIIYKFPKQKLVYGPMQIEQRIDQDTTISPQLTLLGQQGSVVIRGNLLTIPIDDSLLYVEPIYIQASGGERSLPELKKVIVSYKNQIVMSESLQGALEKIFGVEAEEEKPPIEIDIDEDVDTLIAKANELFNKAQEAQKNGEWAAYGDYINQLEEILNTLQGTTAE